MGNKNGTKLDYRQESPDETFERAKGECVFSDRLYEILLAYQRGTPLPGRPPGTPPGNVGDLSAAMSRVYNAIWTAAIDLNGKKKKQEVIA